MKGYRTPQACKDIQARLHRLRSPVPGSNQVTTGSSTLESDADTAIESSYSNRSKELNCLTLLQHYLPDCVTALPAQAAANDASNPLQIDPNAATPKPGWRLTWMNEEGYRYLLYLPPEVHALMVENDGCMLAA